MSEYEGYQSACVGYQNMKVISVCRMSEYEGYQSAYVECQSMQAISQRM